MRAGRRGFLKALAMAPAALPVAAKAAAQKMGLSDAITIGPAHESDLSFSEGPCNTVADDGEWARNALKEMFSSEAVKDRKHRAKRMAMTLDPDLAANHSMSPVAAYSIQIERNYKRITEEQKSWYSREIEEHAKQMFKLQ